MVDSRRGRRGARSAAHAQGTPVVVARRGRRRGEGGALARPEVVVRPRPGSGAARARSARAHVWLSPRRDVLDLRLRPRRRTVGRRDAVEVPRRRLGRAVGRAARRRDRDPVVREPALRAGRARAPPRGAVGRGGRRAADRRRRRSRATAARRRRRRGPRRDVHRRGCHAWAGGRTGDGYAAQGNILVSGATVDALAETFEATAGGRSRSGCSTASTPREAAGGDSRGRQSAALLVVERDGGYAGLSDTLVDLRVDDHADPLGELRGSTGSTTRSSAAPRATDGSPSTTRCARSSTSGSPRARPRDASPTGRASRTSRSGSTESDEIDPVVLADSGARHERAVSGSSRSTSSDTTIAGQSALAHDPLDARHRVLRDQRVDGDRGRPADHRRARRGRGGRDGHEELYLVLDGPPRSRSTARRSTRRRARSSTCRIPR